MHSSTTSRGVRVHCKDYRQYRMPGNWIWMKWIKLAHNLWNACACTYVPVQSCRPGRPAAMYRTSSMLFIASLRCHMRMPACAMCRLGRPSQQRRKEAKRPLKIVAILVLRSVTGQSCYRSYRYPYTLSLVEMKQSLSLLSIERSLRSREGCGGQKITPQLLNEAFPAKATRPKSWKCHKKPYETSLETYKRVM